MLGHLAAVQLPSHAVRLLLELAVLTRPLAQQLDSLAGELLGVLGQVTGELMIESLYLAGEEGVELLLLLSNPGIECSVGSAHICCIN